jgi:hypothetical protein
MTASRSQETERQVAEQEAWATYRESLRDLAGQDYEEAERASWERLQRALRDLGRDGTAD